MSKRQQLMDTALELFYRHGVRAIGINEVLKASTVAKRTLYSHFDSKDELVLAALQCRHDTFLSWLESNIEQSSSNDEMIQKLFAALRRWFRSDDPTLGAFRGCFFINTSAEFSDPDSPISQACRAHKRDVRKLIGRHLPRADESLADTIFLLKEGAITTAYLTGDGDQVVEQCLSALQGLVST
ncbi:TetR/AcrR family transcriptional regulator [Reinekea blandensis]|uniref:Putative transcriptional regulator n=1 Tax=Reinekea blandensis MED297 TaxID=314283 RepID=A4BB29_9GAMM|nr:TetR/AcrR family transcriptional regulator [Reinekea blandensis]EAR10642.1 putative transcriptional regulator [Reinekea sp. MED297] [Reinekea blandensis MED297]